MKETVQDILEVMRSYDEREQDWADRIEAAMGESEGCMFWNHACPDEGAQDSISDLVSLELESGAVSVGDWMEIQRAISLPNAYIRIIGIGDSSVNYEFITAQQAKGE